jgi:hypothetical protein
MHRKTLSLKFCIAGGFAELSSGSGVLRADPIPDVPATSDRAELR